MSRVIHFEIHANDPDRAVKFYSDAFGWDINKWGDVEYWLINSGVGAGIDGAILRRKSENPSVENKDPINAYVCTIEVEKLEEFTKKVIDAGGIMVTPPAEIQNIGKVAYFKDTEGNIFGMLEPVEI